MVAKRKASAFATGSVPGMARSMAQAWVFGSAPNAVLAPEKIFVLVASCTCTSRPITVSHCILSSLLFDSAALSVTQFPVQSAGGSQWLAGTRSEEHTSELQSR